MLTAKQIIAEAKRDYDKIMPPIYKYKEIWRDIEGYNGDYQISNFGNVKSLKRNKHIILKKFIDKYGYVLFGLTKNGVTRTTRAHRLVATAFISNPENKKTVNHIDKNKTNNCVGNLEWTHYRENQSHGELGLGSSKYVGVSKNTHTDTWCSQIYINRTPIKLGNFINELDAAKAYIDALKEHGVENKYAEEIYYGNLNK